MLQCWQTTHAFLPPSGCWAVTRRLVAGLHLKFFSVGLFVRAVVVDQDANAAVVAPLTLVLLSLGPDELLEIGVAHSFLPVTLNPLGQLVGVTTHV